MFAIDLKWQIDLCLLCYKEFDVTLSWCFDITNFRQTLVVCYHGRTTGKKKRLHAPQKIIDSYRERWPGLRSSRLPHHAFCTVCNVNIDISHQGATGKEHSMMCILSENHRPTCPMFSSSCSKS